MTRVVAVANQKGGVGKTTTSVNLAASLAVAEYSVLLIDLDPQANATSGLGFDPPTLATSVYQCLSAGTPAKEAIQSTGIGGLDVIPANADLVGAELELASAQDREYILKRALADVFGSYAVVIIDCPPALGLLTINALVAAGSVLVPVQAEYYAMEGLGRLMATVELVQHHFNQDLKLEGIVLTMVDARNSLSKQVSDEIREHFKEAVYQTLIPRNVTLAEAPSYGRPVLLYNAASSGARAYLELAKEFLAHGEKSPR